jgi:hypothetical protein
MAIQNRYSSVTLNLVNNCSWWLNDPALRLNINLLCHVLPQSIAPTFVLQQYSETSE